MLELNLPKYFIRKKQFSEMAIILLCTTLMLLYCPSSTKAGKHGYNCVQRGITFTCDTNFPKAIPRGVTDIYITNYDNSSFNLEKRLFDNSSDWKSVRKLDININSRWIDFKLENNSFSVLYNLLDLGFHAPGLVEINIDAFKGLGKVQHIDLSGCIRLSSAELVRSIMSMKTVPNLRSLNLKKLFTAKSGNIFSFDKEFLEMLYSQKIQWIRLSGTNILIHNYGSFFNKTLSSLEYLDASDISVMFIPVSNKISFAMLFNTTFRNVKSLNFSNVPSRFMVIDNHMKNAYFNSENYYLFKLPNLEIVDLSYTIEKELYMNNVTFDMSHSPGKWKSLFFRGNNFRICNTIFLWPKHSQLKLLDMSLNGMEYVSRNVFPSTVEVLIMSDNSLDKMEHSEEFEYIFEFLSLLECLDLSQNSLTFIPEQMFGNNQRLKRLTLKGNKLNTVSFNITHLQMLEDLDIRSNRIQNIEGNYLIKLVNFFELRRVENTTLFKFQINENPLECSCKTVQMIKWLAETVRSVTKMDHQCSFGGKQIVINGNAIEKSEFDCIRTTITIAISVFAAITTCLIATILIVIISKVLKRKRIHIVHRFINDFRSERINQKHFVFLSYSSDDGDLVMDQVYINLVHTLEETFGAKKDIVCHGDGYFRPGFSIINESMRCISNSCVVIFVVSQSFCLSDWCRMEVKEAYEQDKPIILIFIEQVDKNIMPLYLLNIFERQTRVKLVHVEGKYKLIPHWTPMCKSALELASIKNQEKREDTHRLRHYYQVR